MNEEALSKAQFDAARMWVARLHAEAAGIAFDVADVGWQRVMSDDSVCAVAEDGTNLHQGDVLYSAVVLLWSMVVTCAHAEGSSVEGVISRLALGVAAHEPSDSS